MDTVSEAILAVHASVEQPIARFPALAELAAQQLRVLGAAMRFEDEELRVVVASMTVRRFAPGSLMLREGERRSEGMLMLVLAGDVSVDIAELGHGERVPISVMGAGQLIGEMALLDGAPHSATCLAVSSVTVACLSRGGLERLVAEHPRAAAKLLVAIGHGVADRLRSMNDQLRIYSRLAGHLQAEITRLERPADQPG